MIVMLKKIFVLALCLAPAMPAGLLRIELSERSDVLAGKSFGSVGPYERLVGKAYFAVDPKLPANQIVCDVEAIEEMGVIAVQGDYLDQGMIARHATDRVAADLMELITQAPADRF